MQGHLFLRALPLIAGVLLSLTVPSSAAARGTNVYVTNFGYGYDANGKSTSSISVINTSTNQVSGEIGTEDDGVALTLPRAAMIAITPDGSRAYVTDAFWSPGAVSVIDMTNNTLVKPGICHADGHADVYGICVGDVPTGIAITPDGRRAYVGNLGPDDVSVIDTDPASPTYNTVVKTIPDVPGAFDIAIAPDGRHAYATTSFSAQGVTVIDTRTNQVVDTIPLSAVFPAVFGIAVTPDGQHLYVAVGLGPGIVYVVDTATHQVTDAVDVGFSPAFLAITPDGQKAYVTGMSDTVKVIDTATNKVETTIGGVNLAYGVGITPDGKTAYVTNYCAPGDLHEPPQPDDCKLPSTVAVIDTATNKVIATAPVGITPVQVAIPPAQGGPTASFAAQAGTVGSPTSFDASASSDPGGSVVRFDWDFGDGTTLANGGPTPSHTYDRADTYTVTLTVTGDEGCTADLIFTGRTAYCNGFPPARASKQVTVSGACAASLTTPAVSVSHWRMIGTRLRGRLKAYPGGYYLRSSDRSLLALQVRGIRGQRERALKRVNFYLDGERVASDRKSPYMVSVDPSSLATGYHDLKALVYSRQGKKHDLSLRFLASNCEDAAFSVSMTSKVKRAHPNLELRARSGGAALESVTFTLPNGLTIRTGALQGKRIGEIKLRRESGTKSGEALRFKSRSDGAAELAAGSGVSARLSFKGKEPTLSVAGLKSQDVTAVGVEIYGKHTRMLKNPNSCKTKLKFTADLTLTDGKSVTLKRSLQMCK